MDYLSIDRDIEVVGQFWQIQRLYPVGAGGQLKLKSEVPGLKFCAKPRIGMVG